MIMLMKIRGDIMDKQSYSERFKIISEKEACFEEAFVLLFEAIDEIVYGLKRQSNAFQSNLLIDAINGHGVWPGMEVKYKDLVKFNGNQHNESWCWKKDELEKMSNKELEKIYTDNDYERYRKVINLTTGGTA